MNRSRNRVIGIVFLGTIILTLVVMIMRAEFQIDRLERRVNILLALTPGTQEKEILARIPHRMEVRTYEAGSGEDAGHNLVIPKGGHALNFDSYEAETLFNAAKISSIWVSIDKDGHCTGSYIQAGF